MTRLHICHAAVVRPSVPRRLAKARALLSFAGDHGAIGGADGVMPGKRQSGRQTGWLGHILALLAASTVVALVVVLSSTAADAQRRQRAVPIPVPQPTPRPSAPRVEGAPQQPEQQPQPETVTADVSTRNVAVTSNFSGSEIVVFGAVDNSRQPSAESGLYDVVIVVVGTPTRAVARKKDRIAGLFWMNTDSIAFDGVPSYYAIASTRPLDEIASPEVLKATGIGFDYIPMTLAKSAAGRTAGDVTDFRQAIVRLKRRERLYGLNEYAVAFIGRSLFRASVDVPANVVVGPFETRVFLFRNGELLSQYNARLDLERQGLEEVMHVLAFKQPLAYGIIIVCLAMGTGLIAAIVFRGVSR